VATVIKRTERHDCLQEVADVDEGLYVGSEVECSCGQQFVKRDDQRDGLYWAKKKPPLTIM
jgi:hypothetical protein